ncbi:MAG: hypothetical protein ACR2HA_11085 [Nocardioides sp.]
MRMSSRLGRVFLLAILVLVTGGAWAAPAQATFPGPNGRIAFADFNTGQLYSINPDGTSPRQLTQFPSGGFAGQPDWSPDARRIAFTGAVPNGEARLYVMDRDGSRQHLIFDEQPGFGDFSPAYTPDASRLVFQRCETDTCAIYSVRVDGTQLRALTRFQQRRNVFDIQPTVSPDGATIAFARFNAGGITSQVYVMGTDGSDPHPITTPTLEGFAPDWTPDGQHLLVTSNAARLGAALYQVNPDGTGLQRLTRPPFPHNDILPSSSPQGDQIVFSSDRAHPDLCCQQLVTVNADGSGLRRLNTGLLGAIDADWGSAPPDTTPATPPATSTAAVPPPAPDGCGRPNVHDPVAVSAAIPCGWLP